MESTPNIHTSLLVLLLFAHCLPLQSILVDDDTSMSGAGSGVVAGTGTTTSTIPLGVIQRTTKQQVLATLPPTPPEYAAPFLTSPSGKYTASLVRLTVAAPNAGSYGDLDFCYVQIQDDESSAILWESQCGSVSSSGECSLVFDEDAGLELLDGSSNPVWSTLSDSSSGSYPLTVELDEDGGMWVVDETGNVVWSTAEVPMVSNLSCGWQPPAAASPTFAGPDSGGINPELGQQPPPVTPAGGGLNQQLQAPSLAPSPPINGGILQQHQPPPQSASEAPSQLSNIGGHQQYSPPLQQPLQGVNNGGNLQGSSSSASSASAASAGLGAQPLVDNTPYDSGCTRKGGLFGMGLSAILLLLFYGFGL